MHGRQPLLPARSPMSGVDEHFMKELAATLTPGSSTLFVLVRRRAPEKVLEELKGTGGMILKTSLSHEDEARLQAALSAEPGGGRTLLASDVALAHQSASATGKGF